MRDLNNSFTVTPELSEPSDNSSFVMSVVWSRQQAGQRTFGTTVSIAGLVSQVRSEGALCECHELRAIFDANLFQSCSGSR